MEGYNVVLVCSFLHRVPVYILFLLPIPGQLHATYSEPDGLLELVDEVVLTNTKILGDPWVRSGCFSEIQFWRLSKTIGIVFLLIEI